MCVYYVYHMYYTYIYIYQIYIYMYTYIYIYHPMDFICGFSMASPIQLNPPGFPRYPRSSIKQTMRTLTVHAVCSGYKITGWWFYPSWKLFVNGKDYPIYEMENKTCLKPPTRCGAPYVGPMTKTAMIVVIGNDRHAWLAMENSFIAIPSQYLSLADYIIKLYIIINIKQIQTKVYAE